MGWSVSLQNSTLTIEEFHSKLQEATNFPLRPFVIPFLKVNKGSPLSGNRDGVYKGPGKGGKATVCMAGILCVQRAENR